MSEIQIRKALPQDISGITKIYNEAILNGTATFDTETKSEEERMIWLTSRNDRYPVIVAIEENEVVAWASLNQYSDRLAYANTVENSLYVYPSHHGKGIGKLLMHETIKVARENKIHTILARITDGNKVSIKLHEDVGFKKVGVMKEVGFKFGRLIDVHLMQVILD